ncbi:MAG: AAA family ATPase [bacterium]
MAPTPPNPVSRSVRRFTRTDPCRICGGYVSAPRGKGKRCYGFLSSDGEWCHCTREEYAGGLRKNENSNTYTHRLVGDCECGKRHDPRPATTAQPPTSPSRARIIATYDYCKGDGTLSYQVVRYEPKDFRQRQPDGKDGWIWNLNGVERVLYHLPELLEADLKELVFVTEGEKDADRLAEAGLVVTTCPQGAGKWSREYSETLRGRGVVILPDNDKPGIEHAEKIAESLQDVATEVRIVRLPGLPDKGDVSDWLNAGNTVEQLTEFVKRAPLAGKILRALTISDLLEEPFPPRAKVLDPIIETQSLAMLFSARGVGKTHVCLGMGYAVATGAEFLRWNALEARRVLYVDGEMPGVVMQQRLASLVANSEQEPPAPDYFRIITPDCQDRPIPDFSKPDGQKAIEQYLDGIELLILDNLSTLFRSGEENVAESWILVQEWILSLRRRGIAVLLVHHSGKTGLQRGTSRKEDILDTVICLKRPADYVAEQGCRFEVHYQKCRGFHGRDAKPFEAQLQTLEGAAVWTCRDLEESLTEQVAELHKDGLKQREIASELSIGVGTVNRHLKKAEQGGLLKVQK